MKIHKKDSYLTIRYNNTIIIIIAMLTILLWESSCAYNDNSPTIEVEQEVEQKIIYNTQPTWSPNGEFIAFRRIEVIGNASKSSIWVMRADGTGEKNLTSDYQNLNGSPTWSPQGNWITFISDRSGNIDVWIIEVTKKELLNLTSENFGVDSSPTWSPDGRFVAYESAMLNNPRHDIRIAEIGTENNINVTSAGPYDYMSPTWSPDGHSLAFIARKVTLDPVTTIPVGIWTTSRILGNLNKLATSERLYTNIEWSPTGDYLATVVQNQDEFNIWILNTDGTFERNLTSNNAVASVRPVWSPNGQNLAFYSRQNNNIDIWKINIDGTEIMNLTFHNLGRDEFPAWSPDGTKIAYESSLDLIGSSDIWVMNSDGSNPVRLTGK